MIQGMKDQELTISELEEISGVSRRTIHFYIKEEVLPPPEGKGGGARYSQDHVLRLELIRKLQRSHLKLSGIKEALENMSAEEMKEILDETPKQHPKWDVNTLDNWLHGNPVEFEMNSMKPMKLRESRIEDLPENDPNDISFLDWESADREDRGHTRATGKGHLLQRITRQPEFQKESWQRISITDGVELNIRQDVLRNRKREIVQVLREIREKLDR